MLKIAHISDFHLNKSTLDDWNKFIKPAFLELMQKEFPEGNALIACTGDILDKGGHDFGGVEQGLKVFKDEVIAPILSGLDIPVSNFVCIPGNHDIDRNADDEVSINGLNCILAKNNPQKINQYVESLEYSSQKHSRRIAAYKAFERELYTNIKDIHTSFLGTTFILNVGNESIGIAGFNSVWNCSDDQDRENGICISEYQYKTCTDLIKDCTYKIALIHHPLDWLDKETESIQCWMKKDYDILLNGHVHSTDSSIITKFYGSLFIDTAPAFENDIRNGQLGSFANGINIIEIKDDKSSIIHKGYKYDHTTRSYPDTVEECLNCVSFSSEEETIVDRCIKYIRGHHYDEYDNSIIPHKASAIKTLKEAFVLPPIIRNGDESNKQHSLGEILNDTSNIILFGSHESGKSTILYRMIIELIDNNDLFQVIPAYIDFSTIGSKDIETCLKTYLDCNSNDLRTLLKGNFITLFLDNYAPAKTVANTCNRLYTFIKDNGIRVIATHDTELNNALDSTYTLSNSIAFETYFIHPFKAENVRRLMEKWNPGARFEDTNDKLQKMVSSFSSYSLPCSAMSVSLYLWSTENTDRKPVNPALLLDIYLEIILEKLNKDYLYRDSFDYENKIMLLSNIAKYILDESIRNPDFQMTYAQYLNCITNYLEKVGFEKVEADKIGDYFIHQKIFTKHNNYIHFTHSCFYYFLLAKKMLKDDGFRDFIISEKEYYKYERVIDYYAGLNRCNRSLLDLLLQRFDTYFSPLNEIESEINKNIDISFTLIKTGETNFRPIVGNVNLTHACERKGSQEDVEKRANEVFDNKLSRIADTYTSPNILYPELMIVMLSKAIRNLDGVEDVDLKTRAYTSLIKKSVQYAFVLKESLARYANKNNGTLPYAFSSVTNLPHFLKYMPFGLQCSIHDIMGSTKIFTPIKKKIAKDNKDKTISDIEKYMSIAMLWDSTGLENIKEVKRLIRTIGNNCVLDYLYNKIYYRYSNLISVGSAEEEQCIELLADLKVKGHAFKAIKKGLIINEMHKERNNRSNALTKSISRY